MSLVFLIAANLAASPPEPPSDVPPPCSHLHMLRFDSGSASISPIGREILKNFAVPYVQFGLTSRVTVNAWTDSVGSRASNLRLSQARGEAVRDLLVKLGVPRTRIWIVPHEKGSPITQTPDGTPKADNRVVSVVEEVSAAEMARRKAAWAAFPTIVC